MLFGRVSFLSSYLNSVHCFVRGSLPVAVSAMSQIHLNTNSSNIIVRSQTLVYFTFAHLELAVIPQTDAHKLVMKLEDGRPFFLRLLQESPYSYKHDPSAFPLRCHFPLPHTLRVIMVIKGSLWKTFRDGSTFRLGKTTARRNPAAVADRSVLLLLSTLQWISDKFLNRSFKIDKDRRTFAAAC